MTVVLQDGALDRSWAHEMVATAAKYLTCLRKLQPQRWGGRAAKPSKVRYWLAFLNTYRTMCTAPGPISCRLLTKFRPSGDGLNVSSRAGDAESTFSGHCASRPRTSQMGRGAELYAPGFGTV